MLVAVVADKTALTDPLAYTFLAARIAQSTVHLISTSAIAINIRFTAFAVQMTIAAYWFFKLIAV